MQMISSNLASFGPGSTEFIIMIVAIGCTTAVAFGMIAMIHSISTTRAREATKREIAAYVAEGTIDPERAIALIEAGKSTDAQEIAAAIHGHTPQANARPNHA